MINPLLVATDGYLPNPTPLSIAVRGYLGGGAIIVEKPEEYRGGGQRGDAWDLEIFEEDLLIREDEELLEIIIMALTSGVID
jgi:hypothetical protein